MSVGPLPKALQPLDRRRKLGGALGSARARPPGLLPHPGGGGKAGVVVVDPTVAVEVVAWKFSVDFHHRLVEPRLRVPFSSRRPLAERLGLKTGQLFGAIRIAVTGRADAPPLFDTLAVLGKERVVYRLGYAMDLLAGAES